MQHQKDHKEDLKYLVAEDRSFIQKHCIDAIRLKKQEKVTKAVKSEIKEEVKALDEVLAATIERDGESPKGDDEGGNDSEETKRISAQETRPKKTNGELKAVMGKKKTNRQQSHHSESDEDPMEKPSQKKVPATTRRKKEAKTN